MARSMWRGAIGFGMVAIPLKLYKATDEGKGGGFRQLCPDCDQPIKAPRVCPSSGQPVQGDLHKGFEVGKGEYVLVDDNDLLNLAVSTLHTITLEQFITPPGGSAVALWAQGSYYLEPEDVGRQAFALLRAALEQTHRWGVGKIAMRDREHLCVVAPHGKGLLLSTLAWPQDVRPMGELSLPDELPLPQAAVDMAVGLIDNLTRPFDPSAFSDTYRAAVLDLVEAKRYNRVVPLTQEKPSKGADDLMTQLRASITAAEGGRKRKSKVA